MTPAPEIERLLNMARLVGIRAMDGRPATSDNLGKLAYAIKLNILLQVQLGLWSKVGIYDPDQFNKLRVSAEITHKLNGPPIALVFDFSETPLATVITESVSV